MSTHAGPGTTWTARSTSRRIGLIVAVSVLSVLTLAGAALAIDVDRYASAQRDLLLPGTTIAGVDVGGMSADTALAAVEEALTSQLDDAVVEIEAADRTWRRTRRELGATHDAAAQVDAALAAAEELSWWDWAQVRYRSQELGPELDVTIHDPASGPGRLAREIAAATDFDPVDAELEIVGGAPTISPGAEGRRVEVGATAGLIAARVTTGGKVSASVTPLYPEVPTERFDEILLLDQTAHRLDVYLRGRLVRSFTVATGTGNYPTPTGRFEVTLKRYMPTWVNPDPRGWGASMPARIGPGPNNPLGVRALNWSAPGAIRFHGTANVASLGRDASHGCVRLSNADVVELYNMVDVGAVIVSMR
ncbi:MAG: L,D-transpeptidase/peptidoglycan binding protein [Actinobacteria bacterium]|nr:L,D-transpeptidase/peptidoglycan binding protein [Actinomycetota bacterium]